MSPSYLSLNTFRPAPDGICVQCVHPVAVRAVSFKQRADLARAFEQLSQRAIPSKCSTTAHVYVVSRRRMRARQRLVTQRH